MREALTQALETGHLKLIRLKYFPAFVPRLEGVTSERWGTVINGRIKNNWVAGEAVTSPDKEELFDLLPATIPQWEGFEKIFRAAKSAVLDNTVDVELTYRSLGTTAIDEIVYHYNSLHPDRLFDVAQFTAFLVTEVQGLSSRVLAPSYALKEPDFPVAATVFERQFLFNLTLELAHRFEATDFQVPDPMCASIKLLSLSRESANKNVATRTHEPQDVFRLMRLAGIPDIAVALKRDFRKSRPFVDLISSTRAEEFRAWYHENAGTDPDEIVAAYIRLISEASLVEGTSGKVLRYLIAGAVGLLPVVGTALGLVVSAADSFFVERLANPRKPKLFIEELREQLM